MAPGSSAGERDANSEASASVFVASCLLKQFGLPSNATAWIVTYPGWNSLSAAAGLLGWPFKLRLQYTPILTAYPKGG